MPPAYESLRVAVRNHSPWIFPVISTWTAIGDAAYGVDTMVWGDALASFSTPDDVAGMWVFRPDSTVAKDREAQIDSTVLATGRLVPAVAWTNAPGSGDQYEVHASRPYDTFLALVQVMKELMVPALQAIACFADADMESSGVSSWTLSNLDGGNSIKTTTEANVKWGPRALRTLLNGANGYAEGASVRVVPGQSYFVSVPVRVDTAGPAVLVVYDKTNSVEIQASQRVSHSLERYMVLQREFAAPANCEEVSVRLQGTAASDDFYWGPVHGPYKASDTELPAPTGLTADSDLRKLIPASYGLSYASGVYDAASRQLGAELKRDTEYRLRSTYDSATKYRLDFLQRLPMQELWAETLRPANDVTAFVFTAAGETSPTTALPETLLVFAWIEAICNRVLANNHGDAQATRSLERINDRRQRLNLPALLADYQRDLEAAPIARPDRGWNLGAI